MYIIEKFIENGYNHGHKYTSYYLYCSNCNNRLGNKTVYEGIENNSNGMVDNWKFCPYCGQLIENNNNIK